jgi:hypothetical protein
MPLNGPSHSEFQFHLRGNYALAAIATNPTPSKPWVETWYRCALQIQQPNKKDTAMTVTAP